MRSLTRWHGPTASRVRSGTAVAPPTDPMIETLSARNLGKRYEIPGGRPRRTHPVTWLKIDAVVTGLTGPEASGLAVAWANCNRSSGPGRRCIPLACNELIMAGRPDCGGVRFPARREPARGMTEVVGGRAPGIRRRPLAGGRRRSRHGLVPAGAGARGNQATRCTVPGGASGTAPGCSTAAMASTPEISRGPGRTTMLSASIAHTGRPGSARAASRACSTAPGR